MTRRNKSIAGFALMAMVTLIALVAYRVGMHRGLSEARPGTAGAACVDIQQAGARAGQDACISARVLRVFTSRSGNTFLDFCEDYRSCPFTSVIFASDRSKFGDLTALQGRQLELRGKVKIYREQPEIVLSAPDQIREAP